MTLAELMGHSDVRLTMEFYQRSTDENKRAAARSLDRVFRSSTSHRQTGTD